MKERKIEIWGTYPPPIGGVSMHIMRLTHSIEHKIDFSLKDFHGKGQHKIHFIQKVENKLITFLKLPFQAKKVIHLHSRNALAIILILLLGFRHKFVFTVHGKVYHKLNKLYQTLIKLLFNRVNAIIVNDPNYANELSEHFHIRHNKFKVIEAYIKPLEVEMKGLPNEIIEFKQKHKMLFSANAYKIYKNEDGDVYGLDQMITLMANLKAIGASVGLVFCIPQKGDEEYMQECKNKIKDLHLTSNILLYNKSIPNGFEVWANSDVFFRPTLTDIEGISVKEALDFGTPTIASNVCKRPSATILYKKGDVNDLTNKTIELLANYKRMEPKIDVASPAVESILEIYRSLQ